MRVEAPKWIHMHAHMHTYKHTAFNFVWLYCLELADFRQTYMYLEVQGIFTFMNVPWLASVIC